MFVCQLHQILEPETAFYVSYVYDIYLTLQRAEFVLTRDGAQEFGVFVSFGFIL